MYDRFGKHHLNSGSGLNDRQLFIWRENGLRVILWGLLGSYERYSR